MFTPAVSLSQSPKVDTTEIINSIMMIYKISKYT